MPAPSPVLRQTTRELKVRRSVVRAASSSQGLAALDRLVRRLVEQHAARRALPVGAVAPDFILPDPDGRPVRLYALLERGPVVLVFYRGGWCPFCEVYLRGLQRELFHLHELGAELVAVAPQLPDASLRTKIDQALAFPMLSDAGLKVARKFGLAYHLPPAALRALGVDLAAYNGESGATALPLAATYIVDRDRTVRTARIDEDPARRLDPIDVLAVLTDFSVARHRQRAP